MNRQKNSKIQIFSCLHDEKIVATLEQWKYNIKPADLHEYS